jgi:hypothetical protein
MNQAKLQEYLDVILQFLRLDLTDTEVLIKAIAEHEPPNRVVYDAGKREFVLGMAKWNVDRMRTALMACREAIVCVMDKVVRDGQIGRDELSRLNQVHHDLQIQYVYDPDTPTKLNLNYIIPDSKIAWETGMCPHCGETVTIHLFPDPMPVIGYEAIINTLRLVTRSVRLTGSEKTGYALALR